MADYRIRVIIDPTQARRGANEVDRSLGRVNRSADRTRQLLTRAFAFVGVVEGIRRLAGLSDAFTEVTNRVRVAGEEIGGTNGSLDALFEIANRTRAPVSEMVRLFTRGALASKELGASQADLLLFTEAVGKGFAIQGSSAQKNADAILQLSQALGSSLVRGEEFNSILEGGFPIALAAARGIDRFGGSVSRLREAVVAGQVTSQEFFRGILAQADELDRLFQATVPTISQSLVILRNNLILLVGEFNEGTGAAQFVSESIIALSKNIQNMVRIITIAAIVFGARYVRSATIAELQTLRTARAVFALQTRMAATAGASRLAARGMALVAVAGAGVRGAIAGLGGPVGIIALIAFATYEWNRANREASSELEGLSTNIDTYRASLEALNEDQLAARRLTLTDAAAEAQGRITELRQDLELLDRQLTSSGSENFDRNRQAAGFQTSEELQIERIRVLGEISGVEQEIERRFDQIRIGNEQIQRLRREDPDQPATTEDPVVDIDKLRTAYERLQSRLDPIAAAQREYATSVELLNDANSNGIINIETRDRLLARSAELYRDQLDPLQAVINALDEEIRLEGLSAEERRIQIQLLEIERDLIAAGIPVDAAALRLLEDRVRTLDRLANAQEQLNSGQADRNALITREIEVMNREATITRLVGDEQAAARARLNIEEAVRQKLREADRELTEDQIDNLGRLTDAQALQITEASKLIQELAREAELYETIRGPLRTYQESVTALSGIYNQGRINAAEFDRELENLQLTFLGNQQDIVSGVERGLLTIQSDFRDLASQSSDIVTGAFTTMEDRLIQFTQTGKLEFHSLVNSILADIARIVLRQQLIGPIANLFTSALASVFTPTGSVTTSQNIQGPSTPPVLFSGGRAASGGLVFGPGTGRSDSILARLSNGEFVVNSASTRRNLPLLTAINSAPGFQDGGPVGGSRGRGRAMVEVQVIDQRRSGDEVEIQQQTGPGGTDQIQIYIRDAVDSNIASGRHDTALQGRFNLNSPLVPR